MSEESHLFGSWMWQHDINQDGFHKNFVSPRATIRITHWALAKQDLDFDRDSGFGRSSFLLAQADEE